MLSRRSFLQLVGATVTAAAIRPAAQVFASAPSGVYQGRALRAVSVYAKPDAGSAPVGRLWPDSMVTITDMDDGWYRTPEGWVVREGLQPMTPYDASAYRFEDSTPFWAEVAAPIAPVRAYCAADAPLVTRIGHGGVSRVIDALPGEPNGWYGIADEAGQLLGWTQGVFWRAVDVPDDGGDARSLAVHMERHLMVAYEGNQPILEVPFSEGHGLVTGTFSIRRGAPGGNRWQAEKVYDGVSWQSQFGEAGTLAGVYWHNRFGFVVQGGPSIQVTPLIARWLYGWAGDDAHVVVE